MIKIKVYIPLAVLQSLPLCLEPADTHHISSAQLAPWEARHQPFQEGIRWKLQLLCHGQDPVSLQGRPFCIFCGTNMPHFRDTVANFSPFFP